MAGKGENPADSLRSMQVVLTGGTGLVGSALRHRLLEAGAKVRLLRHQSAGGVARKAPPANDQSKNQPDIWEGTHYWDPLEGKLPKGVLESAEAIIHLAGENIAKGRWSAARKNAIRDSRVLGTQLLSQAVSEMGHPPKCFISASAIGVYGDRGDETLTEQSAGGEGFLAEVCREWEAATSVAEKAGVRVVNLRISMVLSRKGGALAKLLLPYRLGLGGPVGHGRQYLSWITLDDLVGVIFYLLREAGLKGPVNATTPHPVTSRAFARELGRQLKRPAFIPLPSLAVMLMFGEMGRELLLSGQRVMPDKLLRGGFEFGTPTLGAALNKLLR